MHSGNERRYSLDYIEKSNSPVLPKDNDTDTEKRNSSNIISKSVQLKNQNKKQQGRNFKRHSLQESLALVCAMVSIYVIIFITFII